MLGRHTILTLCILLTLCFYGILLYMAPWVTLMKSERLPPRVSNWYRVDFVDVAEEPRTRAVQSRQEGLPAGDLSTIIGEMPGELPVQDMSASPPVVTPRMTERTASEVLERAYDLTPEADRVHNMDTRILEIAQETARRDIDIARRLVRPSPDFVLPEGALPALRSRDIGMDSIPLEPARVGPGLLTQVLTPAEERRETEGDGAPGSSFDPKVFAPADKEAAAIIPSLEQAAVEEPIRQEAEKAREESDFTFLDDRVDIRLDTYVPSGEERGYFRLRILPRKDAAIEAAPKDITFIVDASRSMQQRKLNLVARGIADALEKLRSRDQFNILVFRDTVNAFRETPVAVSPENIAEAQKFLDGLESKGQTNVFNALLPIARMGPRENIPGIILVATDGNPTTGERDSRKIINMVAESNALRNSIFTYGAGNTVNTYLLDLLAYRNKGESRITENIQDARTGLDAFTNLFGDPLLIDLKADYGQNVEEDLYPTVIPDFFRQRPITLYGRFKPGKDDVFVARITGHIQDTEKELLFRADLNKAESGDKNIARDWAFQKSFHLIGEISRRGELPELLAELKELAKRYEIGTAYSK